MLLHERWWKTNPWSLDPEPGLNVLFMIAHFYNARTKTLLVHQVLSIFLQQSGLHYMVTCLYNGEVNEILTTKMWLL